MITFIFHLHDSDDCNYQVFVNGKEYTVNAEENTLLVKAVPEIDLKIIYNQPRVTAARVIGVFFVSLLQIPFFLLFECTPDNKWYKNISLYDFEYHFKIKASDNACVCFAVQNTAQNVSVSETGFSDTPAALPTAQKRSKCFFALKHALLKYLFRLFWAAFLLYVILCLCFHNSPVAIAGTTAAMIVFYIVLTVLAVKKYHTFRNSR